jgi:hypothetical protein
MLRSHTLRREDTMGESEPIARSEAVTKPEQEA